MSELIKAIRQINSELARKLIKEKKDKKKYLNLQDKYDGASALMMAIVFNQRELAKLLIRSGANLNLQNIHGETALIMGSKVWENTEIVKLLIEKVIRKIN